MARSRHICFLQTVPHTGRLVHLELVALEHGNWCLLVVAASDEEEHRLCADLNALVIVRQRDLKVVDSVVELVAGNPVIRDIILK